MSAPEWRNTFRVGVYTCEMVYRPGRGLKVEWRPDMPKARSFSAQIWTSIASAPTRSSPKSPRRSGATSWSSKRETEI